MTSHSVSAVDDKTMATIIAAALREAAGCQAAVLFGADHERRTFPFVCSQPDTFQCKKAEFAERGSLARWLRVNDEALVIDDGGGPVEDLSEAERGTLSALHAVAAIPLVCEGRLLGFVVLCDAQPTSTLSERQIDRLMLDARAAATEWHAVQQRAAQQRQAASIARVEQLSMAGQLAATVAHEVRNPLAAVRSLVQFVHDVHPAVGQQDALLAQVMQEIDRTNSLVDGLLQLARPHRLVPKTINLSDELRDAAQFIGPYAQRLGVRLSAGEDHVPLAVRIDPRELRQVLIDVLLNACQACASGGDVTMTVGRTAERGSWVDALIVDTGCGMAAEDAARAFDPFFTTKANGTGLGLALCRDIMRRYGGEITLMSVAGAGTSVVLRFPLSDGDGADSSR
jgi:signal transduction histidine kinase